MSLEKVQQLPGPRGPAPKAALSRSYLLLIALSQLLVLFLLVDHLSASPSSALTSPTSPSPSSPPSLLSPAPPRSRASAGLASLLLLLVPSSCSSWLWWWPSLLRPPVDPIVREPVCSNPGSFPTSSPTSRPLTMALAAETKNVVEQFELTAQDVNKSVAEFLRQMDEGLAKDGTSMSQIPTYVTGVPNGTEKGLYLAVDLGGTNFRVCSVHLNGDTTFNLNYSKVAIPKELMVAKSARDLFAFLAKQIEEFLKQNHPEEFKNVSRWRPSQTTGRIFQLGFTFSFPVQQLAIDKGNLIRWTKGFDIPDAIGKDVCQLLQQELDKLHLPVRVAALVNDTVGTLMARSYTSAGDHRSILGAIFGTGTNGAYIEKMSNIKKPVEGDYDDSTGEMVVNTEWGSFDNQLNVLPNTPWDQALDHGSVNPGIQMFEKRVSGMFLGEIVRLAMVDMIKNDKISLFKDVNSSFNDWTSTTSISKESPIWRPWGIDSATMSVAASDNTPELSTLRQELESVLSIYTPSLEDAQAFKAIANAVGRRAARLSAVAIGAVVLQSGKLKDPEAEVIDVGVDGSLVEHYPFFRDMIYEALRQIDGIGPAGAEKIRIGIAKDGSGVGAALIALVAAGMDKGDLSAEKIRIGIAKDGSGVGAALIALVAAGMDKGDLSAEVKKELEAIQPGPQISATTAVTAAGVLGIIALGALWWARRK